MLELLHAYCCVKGEPSKKKCNKCHKGSDQPPHPKCDKKPSNFFGQKCFSRGENFLLQPCHLSVSTVSFFLSKISWSWSEPPTAESGPYPKNKKNKIL